MREYIGIMLSDLIYSGIISKSTRYENIDLYNEAARKHNLLPCYFRAQDIDLSERTVNGYVNLNGKWAITTAPIPKVIHNRVILYHFRNYFLLEELSKNGYYIYNFLTRFTKPYIYNILAKHPSFQPHLPFLCTYTPLHLSRVLDRYPSLLLKPDNGSSGKGIIKVEQITDSLCSVKIRQSKSITVHQIQKNSLYDALKRVIKSNYHIQECINLANYHSSPFDIRVSVQKNGKGQWKVTGMVGKVARTNYYLTNVAQGGSARSLQIIFAELPLDLSTIQSRIEQVAQSMAHYLEQHLPHLADIGFDFGIDETGHPYFFEMNLRDLRYSFKDANMIETWKETFENPIAYGRFLLDQMNAETPSR